MKKLITVLLIGLALWGAGGVFAEYGAYDTTGEFTKFIEANPLDRDYKQELETFSNATNFSTQGFEKLEAKYQLLWDKELNVIYQKLLAVLNKDEQELLRQSQRGWLQHHLKEHDFVRRVFYQRKGGPRLGSQGNVQKAYAIKDRIRERTFELMEYYQLLGYKVVFEYKKKIK